MSTTLSAECGEPTAHSLAPILSQRWQLDWRHLIVCTSFGALFLLLGYLPRTTSRVWLDISEGHRILQSGGIPAVDSVLPLSSGMPVVYTGWLSHVMAAQSEQWGGPASVVSLYASVVWLTLVLLGCVFFVQSPRWALALCGVGAVLLLDASLKTAAGPATWGALCFALLLFALTYFRAPGFGPQRLDEGCARATRTGWRLWLAVGLLFALWSNLHLSFLAGLAVLAAVATGRLYLVATRCRSLKRVFSDRTLRRWVLVTQAAAVAALLNPYGVGMYYEAVRQLTNERLRETGLWMTIDLRSWTGVLLLATVAALIFALRRSHRRMHPVQAILLIAASAGLLVSGCGLRWFAPIVALVLARHLFDAVPPLRSPRMAERLATPFRRLRQAALAVVEMAGFQPSAVANRWRTGPFAFAITLLCGVIVWTSFVFSPIGHGFLGGGDQGQVIDDDLPLAAGDFLRRQPGDGLVCASIAWSDWLAWRGGPETQLLMNSNFHRLPPSVWQDYDFVSDGGAAWEKACDNYHVTTLLVDKAAQWQLARAARDSALWEVVFEDDQALVARRVGVLKPEITAGDG